MTKENEKESEGQRRMKWKKERVDLEWLRWIMWLIHNINHSEELDTHCSAYSHTNPNTPLIPLLSHPVTKLLAVLLHFTEHNSETLHNHLKGQHIPLRRAQEFIIPRENF